MDRAHQPEAPGRLSIRTSSVAPVYDPMRDGTRLDKQVAIVVEGERRLLAQLIGDTTFSLLDVGCAQGTLSTTRLEGFSCHDFVGIDPSKTAIKVAQALYPDLRWITGVLPSELGTFDVVWSSRVVQHVDNPMAFMRDCWAHVRPGGTVAGTCVAGGGGCTVTGLTNGTTYTVVVSATNANGTGPTSNGVTATPEAATPPSTTTTTTVPPSTTTTTTTPKGKP